MGLVLVILILGGLFAGDHWFEPRRRTRSTSRQRRARAPEPNPTPPEPEQVAAAPQGIPATTAEQVERELTNALLAGRLNREQYRNRLTRLAENEVGPTDRPVWLLPYRRQTVLLRELADELPELPPARLYAAIRLARRGTDATDLVRLLGIDHAAATRIVICAREIDERSP